MKNTLLEEIMSSDDNPKISAFGTKRWYNKSGLLHRIDGPAILFVSGSEIWYKNGKKHRIRGPAVTMHERGGEWWVNGYSITFTEYVSFLNKNGINFRNMSIDDELFIEITFNGNVI